MLDCEDNDFIRLFADPIVGQIGIAAHNELSDIRYRLSAPSFWKLQK